MEACNGLRQRMLRRHPRARQAAGRLMILAVVLMGWRPLLALGQEAAPRDADFTFTISKVIGQPGTEVSLPVLFGRKPGAANVATLRARVRYPAAALKFKRIEDAYLSRRVKLEVAARESGDGGESTLEMDFRLPEPQSSEFPSGHIATLYFDIAAGAADQVIHFNPETWIDGTPVASDSPLALIEPGEVRVAKEPVLVGCFFFSH